MVTCCYYATIWAYAPDACPYNIPLLNSAFTVSLRTIQTCVCFQEKDKLSSFGTLGRTQPSKRSQRGGSPYCFALTWNELPLRFLRAHPRLLRLKSKSSSGMLVWRPDAGLHSYSVFNPEANCYVRVQSVQNMPKYNSTFSLLMFYLTLHSSINTRRPPKI